MANPFVPCPRNGASLMISIVLCRMKLRPCVESFLKFVPNNIEIGMKKEIDSIFHFPLAIQHVANTIKQIHPVRHIVKTIVIIDTVSIIKIKYFFNPLDDTV